MHDHTGLVFPIQWPEPFWAGHGRGHGLWDPVIAWPNGSVPEVVADGQTGLLVASVQEMAAAVGRVGELDPGVMPARVEQQFSAEAMVTSYERTYRNVVI